MNRWQAVLIGLVTLGSTQAAKSDDLVSDLPGLTFNPTFAQYSGFLDASAGNHLHYWLVEAQTSPQWAPLVLWLNGGPGCSSLLGLLTENGPFRVGADGASLVENPHSWNKAANMLFLEAPRDVGFSYRDNATYGYDSVYNDEKTANDNALALIQFFTRFPEYQGRDFYITGESYGGVYVPTLTKKIVELIKNNTTPYINLKGFAVGNGALSRKQLTNSAVDLLYYRGMLGVSQWEDLRQCCPDTPQGPLVDCDFSQFVYIDEFGNPNPRNDTNDPQAIKCGQMVTDLSMNAVWMTYNDVYNTYQDCYNFTGTKQEGINQVIHKKTYNHLLKSALGSMASVVSSSSYNMFSSGVNPFVDQGSRINQQSTDSLNGWSCFSDDYVAAYLARSDVRNALHIPTSVQQWQSCSDAINGQYYIQQTPDLTDTFKYLIDSSYPLKALIYNGDVDLACNYLGDQWFVESLATKTYNFTITRKRTQWTYKRASKYQPQLAGYVKSWNYNQFNIDLLTVKGGGHMVPTDRPGPALQMFYNFIYKTGYNTLVPYSLTTQDLKSDYTSAPSATWTRKQADRVWNLPGLTFNLNFKQYSGYLNGVTGNYLHYWFLESQSNPQTDPLVLWLTGGPGCSGLMALLIELGPFRPNPDGKTLFENVYSWNKMANVLFLESPRGVGFSVQDFTLNNDTVYDDERTARDTLLALKDFFTVYPEYSGRQFFVTGESYGGVYVPTITSLLVDEILAKRFPELNLIGFSVGNGELSAIHNLNSLIQLSYFHGLFGKEEWDSLQQCCNSTKDAPTWLEYCDFTQHVYFGSDGGPIPRRNDFCGNKVVDLQNRVWGSLNNVYNIYQDCYQRTTPDAGLAAPKYMGFIDQGAKISTYSTDSQGGILCYYADGSASYLNEADVRSALHVSPNAANWTACNDVVNENYIQQNNDTGKVFEHMINSGYPLRVLIYNGDVDQACNFLGDQWFIESLTTRNGFSVTKARDAWRYQTQIAGYGKTFDNDKGFKIDLLTVKGGGHMVPTDRPGPALQMITNFFRNQDYNNPVNVDTTLHPLNTQYVVAEQLTQQQNGTNPAFSQTVRNVKKNRIQAKRRRVKARNQLAQNSDANEKVRAAAPPPPSNTTKDQDLITSLPGLTYTPNFKQYSGYLPASTGNYLHYWLTESQLNTSDPLILWLNGGPGCSSLGGFFEELGPFHVNADGETLFENVFSWNKAGNVLFLEAPRGVGFSYRSNEVPDDGMYNDTYTAADTILALQAFFTKFPEYQGRDFYITGESYGGIYVPTLTDALIKQIQSGAMSYVNFVGIAIGNGELSEVQQINSAISLLYFRGDSDKSDYDALSQCCDTSKPQAYCDFSQYYYLDTAGNAWPKKTDGSVEAVCGTLAVQQGFYNVWETDNDVYNTFQDCYDSTANVERIFETSGRRTKRSTGDVSPLLPNPLFVDQAKKVNYKSTDNNGGFSCFGGASAENYLNLQSVRDAIHIPSAFTTHWTDCNDDMNEHYVQQHNDTTSVFQSIIASGYKLNILIYNGDVDMACQFLGDQWFIENLATVNNAQVSRARDQWNYTQNQYQPQIGGYWKQFNFNNGQITLDQLTVKGAGHFVPQDRPGPALQMIYNFVNKLDYNRNLTLDITPSPLLDAYTPAPVTVVRRKADRISALPGLTFKPTFDHHSGYLSSETGESLFYWLVESQTKGTNDPVILWLQGGPGCASTGGLLGEIGPFYVNPDGETIFENIYAWNKAAYVVVIDSPRSIGFSYQDTNVNNDTKWDDDKTANATASALEDFFVAFPQFKHRDFYIAGESYGGVYIPTLTRVLVNRIQSGQSSINLKGIMIGNGMVSAVQDVRTLPDFLYFHGIYDKPTWETLRKCCPSDDSSNYCNYDYYITIDQNVGVIAKNFSDNSTLQDCANLVEALSFDRNWHAIYNQYNLYEDCYATEFSMNEKPTSPTGRVDFMRKYHQSMSRKEKSTSQSSVNPLPSVFDPLDTTANGGYSCYQYDAIANYLSLPHVRYALHVPDYVSQWEFCKDINYANLYNDTTSVFNDLLTSGYNLKVLIYNGDVDSVCSMFEAQSMINNFAHAQNLASPEPRTPWLYGQQIGGYVQKFRKDNLTIDMMTVKGAGHMVPTDRPGPILQTILNFVSGQGNYNTSIQYDLTRQPLLPQYTEQGAGTVAPVSANTTDAPITNAPVTDSVTTSTKSATNAPSTAAPPSQSTTVQAEATTLSSGNLVATITSVFFVVVSFLL